MESSKGGPEILTYNEVAARLKCCTKHVRNEYVKTGRLPVVRLALQRYV